MSEKVRVEDEVGIKSSQTNKMLTAQESLEGHTRRNFLNTIKIAP